MMRYVYLAVEGPHDLEVVAALLRCRGFVRCRMLVEVDAYWSRTIPRAYPPDGDLLKRVPTPTFFASPAVSVAVHPVGGINEVARVVADTLLGLDTPPDALGVVVDADNKSPLSQWTAVAEAMRELVDPGPAPGVPGDGAPRAGIFVLPDNENSGTLEQVLLDCAGVAYPKLLGLARAWIVPLSHGDTTVFPRSADRADFKKPSGKDKAIVGAIANVLRPGKAVQVSIQDNDWLRHPDALSLPRVTRLLTFLDALIAP